MRYLDIGLASAAGVVIFGAAHAAPATAPAVNLGPSVPFAPIVGWNGTNYSPFAVDSLGQFYCNNCSGGSGGGNAAALAPGVPATYGTPGQYTSSGGLTVFDSVATPHPVVVESGTVTATGSLTLNAGTNTIGAVTPPSPGQGADASANALSPLGNTLASFTVTNPGQFYCMNLSNANVEVALGATTPTILVLSPGAGNGSQGGTTDPIPWFTGTVTVTGSSSSQVVACRHN